MYKKFREYIENSLNVENLIRVENVSFSTSFNKLNIDIIYDDNKKEIFYQNKEIIDNIIKKYVNEDIEIITNYKKSFLDCDYLKVLLKKYLAECDLVMIKKIGENNIEISQNNQIFTINITFDLSKDLAEVYEKIFHKFVSQLQEKYFYQFNLKMEYLQQEIDHDIIEQYLESIEEEKEDSIVIINNEFVEIENQTEFLGEIIKNEPIDLTKISSPIDYITLCGKCLNFQKREFKKEKKDKETGEVTITESYRYSFKVKYKDSAISCSYFPKSQEKNKDYMIEDGQEICVDGKIEEYMGALSLKVKNINLCNIIEAEEIVRFLPIPKRYNRIFPEKFESQEQTDIFSIMEEKSQKDCITKENYVVFDLETTGLSPEEDLIIEISAIKIEAGSMVECFNTFVNPQKPIPAEITRITNITDEMVKDAPKDEEIIGDLLKFCQGCTLVAYNAPFDMGFIYKLARKCNYKVENKVQDALALAKEKIRQVKNYKLKTIADYLNVSLVGAHRAINDTLATAKVFLKLLDMD
ncbi:MAG: ribonuclease H-like domain-containing protein [Clostridia bacterium]|nr:ribonuclease H-like domain-containing protein [Clostridia bacterium]